MTTDDGVGEPARDALVAIQSLSVAYRTKSALVHAVSDISFAIPRGAFLTIVGPSGCGKSTILNAIAGFLTPTSGTVRFDGRPVTGPGAERSVVHQQTSALLPWLNVEQNVALGLRAQRVPKRRRREIVDRYLSLVGLQDFGSSAIYELSGGMQQRVMLARALAVESPMLLLDEPLAAIDALQRETMQDLLLKVRAETGRTFLLITHSVEEAVYLSTDVLVMSQRPSRIIARRSFAFGDQAIAGVTGVKASREFVESSTELMALLMNTSGPSKKE